jgi:hypothetical protein
MDVALSRLADYIIAEVMKQPRLYNHHPYWFENSLGEASYDGHFLPAPITRFDKVGKFDVEF